MTAVFCSAKSKTSGQQCRKLVTPPATVCRIHGGGSPQVRAAVARKRQHEQAERSVAEFALSRDVEPHQALLEALHRWAGMVSYLGSVIGEFESASDLKQLSQGSEQFERPAVWVEMYNHALREMAKVAKACVDAGIDERRIRLAEEHGRALDSVLRGVLGDVFDLLGRMLAELVGTVAAEMLAGVMRDDVPAIVRRRLAQLFDPPDELS